MGGCSPRPDKAHNWLFQSHEQRKGLLVAESEPLPRSRPLPVAAELAGRMQRLPWLPMHPAGPMSRPRGTASIACCVSQSSFTDTH